MLPEISLRNDQCTLHTMQWTVELSCPVERRQRFLEPVADVPMCSVPRCADAIGSPESVATAAEHQLSWSSLC
jgi:hypothetical protein